MPLYAYSEELRLEFRRKHRAGVQQQRSRDRRRQASSSRDPKPCKLDKQMDLAIERDEK